MSNQQTSSAHPTSQGQNPTAEEIERAALLAQEQLAGQEDPASQRYCDITIVDLNNREIPIKTMQYEMVFELREYLQTHIYTCLHTNFVFEYNGMELNEYTELQELDLVSNPRLLMKPCKYDDKSARAHIKRLVQLLETPQVLTNNVKQAKKAEESKSASRSRSNSTQEDNQDKSKDKPPSTYEPDEKLKQNYESFMQVIRSQQSKNGQIATPEKDLSKSQQAMNIFKELFTGAISDSSLKKLKHQKCVESIQFSQYHQVTDARKVVGDLFYLVVRTLESPQSEHHITCTANGFFRNDSTSTHFAPEPATKQPPCYSYTLAGCLNQISPSFGKNLEIYFNSILATEPYFLTPLTQPVNTWMDQPDDQKQRISVSNADHLGQTLIPLYGIDPKQMHDWNEEFQVVQNFPTENFIQRMQKDRAVSKIYNDFLESATAGAVAIIEGKVQPLNPNECMRQHVYVYNAIFFSFAVDCPTSYRDSTSTDQNPSFTQSNHDLTGLRQLQGTGIQDLYHLATCLVNYCGHRVICQSIIPGILNNNDLSSLAEYGTVDEKKNLVATEQFHQLMVKVADALNIKVNKVVDPADGKTIEIAGSVEVKGIRGADKRAYIVDLQGLTPRDANYLGEDNHACLLRPELVGLYQRSKNMEYASAKMKDFTKEIEAKRPADFKPKEGTELTDEQKQRNAKIIQEESIAKIKEVEKLLKEGPKYKFNANVFKSNVKLAMSNEELAADEQQVRDLSQFLVKEQIPALINALKAGDGVPTDSQSMQDQLHKNGINMRYLGKIYQELSTQNDKEEQAHLKGDFKHLRSLFEREVVLRCAKHVFKHYMRDQLSYSMLHISHCVAHLLNILFCPHPCMQNLNNGTIKFTDDTVQTQFQSCPEMVPSNSPRAKETNKPKEESNGQLSKKEQKKLRQKQKKQEDNKASPSPQITETEKTMSDILFQANTDGDLFSMKEFSSNTYFSEGLNKVGYSTIFQLTPNQIYQEMKVIAKARFGHDLPDQKKLTCLGSALQKASLLRDLCRAIGVQLKAIPYMLSNNAKQVANYHNELNQQKIEKQNPQNKKRALATLQAITESDVTSNYQYLPFKSSDVIKMFPVVKHLHFKNQDVKNLLGQGNAALKESQMDRAFELYSQANNLLLQISGPMTEDVATCIIQIAAIQFKFGDFLQAIELQTRSIVLLERLYGLDHPEVAYQYSTLAMYYHSCGYFQMSFAYMNRALAILNIVAGENHPEIASIYLNLGLMYQEVEQIQATIDSYQLSVEQNKAMFSEDNIQVASSIQALAQAYFRNQDFRKALKEQERALNTYQAILPANSPHISNAKQQYDYYLRLSVNMEKHKKAVKSGQTQVKPQPQTMDQQELIKLIQEQQRIQKENLEKSQAEKKEKKDEEGKQPQMTDEQVKEAILEQQRQYEMNAFQQRYNRLIQRINNPKQRSHLDILEFQAMRGQVDAMRFSQQATANMPKPEAGEEDQKPPADKQ